MRTKKTRNKSSLIIRVVVLAVAAFLLLQLLQLNSQLDEKAKLLNELNNNISKFELLNEDLESKKQQILNSPEALEQQANEAGLCYPNQQVYQNSAG